VIKTDPHNIMKGIGENAKANFTLVEKFKEQFEKSLPSNSLAILNDFTQKNNEIIANIKKPENVLNRELVIKLIVNLSLLENEMTYHLRDSQAYILKSVEIAFNHLQRQLIADESIKMIWEKAKEKGGTAFEKLGGAHLLLHKIWGVKIGSPGERTDLVLGSKVNLETDSLSESVEGLVLTEWKFVRNKSLTKAFIEQAQKQLQLYAIGSLAAIDLTSYRYIVLVSKDHLDIEENEIRGDEITYKIINIAYAPKTPSKS
jgi:hypothetical protein